MDVYIVLRVNFKMLDKGGKGDHVVFIAVVVC